MKYEKEYQELVHNNLYKDPEYYAMRAAFAYKDYFADKHLGYKKLLEWGCGLGQNIYFLNCIGYDVAGYDISKFAIDFCKKKGLNVSNKLKGKYDVIFCRHVLEHLQDPYNTLKEMAKHLNAGGYLDLIIPYERQREGDFTPDSRNGHLWAWNMQTIVNLIHDTGYKVIQVEKLVEGDGYYKLKSNLLAKLAGWIRGCRELRVVAIKL